MTIDTDETMQGLWVLGYGSLIYKPPPHYKYRIPATIYGFMRRFWQSSIDHRGTPDSPGRVVTLIPYDEIVSRPEFSQDLKLYSPNFDDIKGANDLTTLGVVYYIPTEFADQVREYLDVREQNGYTLHEVEVHLNTTGEQERALKHVLCKLPFHNETKKRILKTNVYIGTVTNEAFVGPEAIHDTAKVISTSRGPSGPNIEYLKLLHDSIEFMSDNELLPTSDIYLNKLLRQVDKINN
ncbi:hypothetical protein NCAS_0A03710 [Naumovozyma castellii]|uniref:glutathione-specific gamma-glutamylcyclotransferase n=1 Tax=Naumovozyma castellii TaxID=27288 RepID=G0V639_NAUCA|nr:hypothetical protein NCAS_0A03710 [Naumovozyma castellii CBS 4309]CCC66929.1 hypothetical protein NCAS_0A03710 [Naumovozyma castellii CBS 4309]